MKVLLVGDASNFHYTLATALRGMGHEAVVVSDGSRWMNTRRDISLLRRAGRVGTVRYVADILRALPRMRGYDVVQIAGQIFLRLKPKRVARVFDYLKNHNGKVILSALGTDMVYYDACHTDGVFRYSDYRIGTEPSPYIGSAEYHAQRQTNWQKPFMREHCRHIIDGVDGVIAALYEYYAAYQALCPDVPLAYGGIPIDTEAVKPQLLSEAPERVNFFIGIQPDRTVIKGTDRLLAAARRVQEARHDECELTVVESVPYEEYVRLMSGAHVLLDQLYSYTPATNALLAMAQGKVAVSGAEPEYYSLIGETDNHPVVNVTPLVEGDIEAKLHALLDNRASLPDMGRHSRDFVVRHNDSRVVAQRHLDFWSKC